MFGEGVVLQDKVVGASPATALSFIMKTSVGMSVEYHVASLVCGAAVGVGG